MPNADEMITKSSSTETDFENNNMPREFNPRVRYRYHKPIEIEM